MSRRPPPRKRSLAYRLLKGGAAVAAGGVVMALWTPVFILIYWDMIRRKPKEEEP